MGKPFWSEGICFECQGTGRCCTARGDYGYVYLSLDDRRSLAMHFHMRTSSFTRKYCDKEDGEFYLKLPGQDCMFLVGKRCSVYPARPTQCRTWPFWPENMKPAVWRAEVAPFCAGVGKGRLYSAQEIASILALHRRSSFSVNRR